MDEKHELPPTCELSNLPTCLLAYLRTCPLYSLCFLCGRLVLASRLPSRSCSCRSLVSPFRSVLIVSPSRRAIREAGRFFSSALVSCVGAVFRHAPRRFRKLILSAVPSRSSSRRAYRRTSSHPSFYSSRGSWGQDTGAWGTVFYLTQSFSI